METTSFEASSPTPDEYKVILSPPMPSGSNELLVGVASAAVTAVAAVVVHKLLQARAAPEEATKGAAPSAAATPELAARRRRISTEEIAAPAELLPSDTVIIVSYQLPLSITRRPGGGFDAVWDSERGLNQEGLNLPTKCYWVGCPGIAVAKDEEDELETMLLSQFGCVAVFLEPELKKDFYRGFCRGYLRPIFHNHLRVEGTELGTHPFQEKQWRAYCNVNRIFATKVMEVYEPGYMCWVHDYHLLLLPSCILRKHRTARIGLFLHSPFPASDVFRTIAVRDELLRAMLNADLIGFLLFEYTRNFLTCCKRMLGLEYEFRRGGFLGVEYGGRHVILQVSTLGVSPTLVKYHLDGVGNATATAELSGVTDILAQRAAADGALPRVIAGVDHLDRLKGVQLKLLGWEALLETYPKYRSGHVLVQICLGSRNQVTLETDAAFLKSEISTIVDRINAKHPTTAYFELKDDMSAAARLAIWGKADVATFTATREAVNVWPLEYVATRSFASLPAGALVLSEFSGFSRVLNGALRVNPFSQEQMVAAFDQALEMSGVEREARAQKDLLHINGNTMEEWGRRYVADLKSMERKQDEDWMAVGFGLASFRMVGMGSDFRAIETHAAVDAYGRAERRAILLDWGGTLTVPDAGFYDHRDVESYSVPEHVLAVLRALCAVPTNHVIILSGLGRNKVQAAFDSVENLSIACEHGFHYRIRGGAWQQLSPGVDTSWREVAEAVMRVYSTRTSGAYVQKKGSSILWNHQGADPEFGVLQARELQDHLQGVLDGYPVVVRTGKGYVEACLKHVNKGVMAAHFIDLCNAAQPGKKAPPPLGFVLSVGDDSTDELMFATLNKKLGPKLGLSRDGTARSGRGGASAEVFTVTVGRKPSEATSYIGDHTEVVALLEALAYREEGKGGVQNLSRSGASGLEGLAAMVGGGGGGGKSGGMRRMA